MPFMREQVEYGLWLSIEAGGTTFVPAEYVNLPVPLEVGREYGEDDFDEDTWAAVQLACRDYLTETPFHDRVTSVTLTKGYGARLSAPGYMDCTDWVVFDNEEEAITHLRETYGDE